MIKYDFHLHTEHSSDSDTPMLAMVKKGISLGLLAMCFTEHEDIDFPASEKGTSNFEVDLSLYYSELCKLKEIYKGKIDLLFGIELGLQPHLTDQYQNYVNQNKFDFIIGSSHVVDKIDPYYPAYFQGRSEDASYLRYFESELESVRLFDTYDVYGHLDYIVRYGPNKNLYYTYEKYADILDEILKVIIQKGKGIEINTGGLRYGLGHPNPTETIIKRYKELGGEIITLGSDAHTPDYITYEFDRAEAILKKSGFQYYTIFENRIPSFVKL